MGMFIRLISLLIFISPAPALSQGQGPSPEQRRTGNLCSKDLDCPVNAFCKTNAYCVCKDGYIFVAMNDTHQGCMLVKKNGEDCNQDIQCQVNLGVHSECLNTVCRCKSGAHFENNYCYLNAKVGERCVVSSNCYMADQKTGDDRTAWCFRGYCTCEVAHSPRDNGTRCVKDSLLSEPCEDELQCAGPGLQCRGTCRCREHWVEHWDYNKCVELVRNLGEPCDFDVQCNDLSGTLEAPQPGATLCLAGTCQCAYNARAVGSTARCWFRRRPGQECKRDEECVSEEDEPGFCLNGRCTCTTCAPDARDFGSGAFAVNSPTFLITAAIFVSAIFTH